MSTQPNLFNFKTATQFIAFIKEVKTLKEVVQCPICGDLVENPLCASCNHIFCSHCIEIHINTDNKCPICDTVIKQIPINDHIERLLIWFRKLNTQLKSTFNIDVFNVSNDELTLIFNEKFLKDTKDVVESTSSVCTFDKLIDSDLQNHYKRKAVKKYTKKVNKAVKQSVELKLGASLSKSNFKDDIFKWLESTKNNFERVLTQTQYAIDEDSPDLFEIPSISQRTPQKHFASRSKSFEIKPKGHVMTLRRHSNQDLLKNCADKEKVVRLLEEECLDRIEMDLNQKSVNEVNKVNNKNGWKRMKKMNNTINKNKGKIQELNVTLTSPLDNKENIYKNQTPNTVIKGKRSFEKLKTTVKKRKLNNNGFDKCINKPELIDQNTQTFFPVNYASVQTDLFRENRKETRNVETQTDLNDFNKGNELLNKSIQTIRLDTNYCTIETQTDDDIFEIKTQPIIIKKSQQKNDTPQNSDLIISLTNPKINSKEECEERIAEMLKNYQIVQNDSESEEDEPLNKVKKTKNKYIMEDLSIEIMSENIDSSLSMKSNLSLKDSNKIDYDRFLQNVMKKYETDVTKPSMSKKKTESQNVYERCDAMIKNIVKTSQRNVPTNKENENNEKDDSIEFEIIEEFNKSFTTPKTLKNKTQSDKDILPCTETMMENVDVDELERCFDLKENSRENVEKGGDREIDEEKQSGNVIILQNVLMKNGLSNEVCEEDRVSSCSEDLFDNVDDKEIECDEDVIQNSPNKSKREGLERCFRQQLLKNQDTIQPPINSPTIIPSSINRLSFFNQTFTPPIDFQDIPEKEKDATNPLPDEANLIIYDSNSEDLDITTIPNKEPSPKNKGNNDVIDLCSINFNDFDEPMSIPKNRDKNTNDNGVNIIETETLQLSQPQSTSYELSQNVFITSTQKSLSKKRFEALEISPIRTEKRKRNSLNLINKSNCSPLNVISQKPNLITQNRFLSSRKQKSILSFVKPDKIDKNESIVSVGSSPSSSLTELPYICCTRLNKDQLKLVVELTKKKLIKYSNNFTTNITHIICTTNENNHIHDHTMKLLKAIAYGKWVLNIQWIQDCLKFNKIIPEADYEALDMSGEPGPKISRLHLKEKLLKGFKIYLEPPFASASKEEVEELITVLDGEILMSLQDLYDEEGIRLIVAESNGTQDDYRFEEWGRKYKVFVVDIEWLSRSIGQYKLVSLRPFGLCSDDNILQLGYPRDLTIEASFSYTQNVVAINK